MVFGNGPCAGVGGGGLWSLRIVRGFGAVGADEFKFLVGEEFGGGALLGLEAEQLFVLFGDDAIEFVAEFFEVCEVGFDADESLFEGFVHGEEGGWVGRK